VIGHVATWGARDHIRGQLAARGYLGPRLHYGGLTG
jgi:hypothetical protein